MTYPPQPPPGYPPGHPPGYPPGHPPGYPPGYPQPPGGRRRVGWIVGGAAAAVALVLAAVVGFTLAAPSSGGDGSAAGGQRPEASQPPAAAPSPTPEQPAAEPPATGGRYGFVADMCEQAELSPAFDVLPPEGDPEDWLVNDQEFGSGSLMSCIIDLEGGDPDCTPANGCFDEAPYGILSITANTYDSPDEARTGYENLFNDLVREPETVQAAEGPWQEGTLELGGGALVDSAAALSALDDNAVVSVDFSVWGDDGLDDDLGVVVRDLAAGILDLLAQ